MAIQPIDLQTLFTQMDKVAKQKSAEKEGLVLQQSLQGAVNLKKQKRRSVRSMKPKTRKMGLSGLRIKNAKKQVRKRPLKKKMKRKILLMKKMLML
jgi:hypothetical protein